MTAKKLLERVQAWLDAGELRSAKRKGWIENPGFPDQRQTALATEVMLRLALENGLRPKGKNYAGTTRDNIWIAFEHAELPLPEDFKKPLALPDIDVDKKGSP